MHIFGRGDVMKKDLTKFVLHTNISMDDIVFWDTYFDYNILQFFS